MTSKLLTFLACAVLWLATAACSTSQKTVAYKTLKSVADTVDTAMKAYAEAAAIGAVDVTNLEKVRAMHDKYRAVFKQAVLAAQFDYATAPPTELATLASQLVSAITQYLGRTP